MKKRPGVRDAFVLDGIDGLPSGVAIVADSTWNAFSATDALQRRVGRRPGREPEQRRDGEAGGAARESDAASDRCPDGAKAVEAVYHYPFLAHATLEPQNCTAVFKNGVMEMWTPTQIPASGQGLVTRGLGLAPKDVIVHITRLGGGFGRRGSNEFSIEVGGDREEARGHAGQADVDARARLRARQLSLERLALLHRGPRRRRARSSRCTTRS